MVWITDKTPIIQSDVPNRIETLCNQIYYDNGNAYLIPKGLITDDYTIPLNINKSKWDVRPSHLHDIGCKYHQLILIELPLYTILERYTVSIDDKTIALDIPKEYLKVVNVSFNECNNLLKRAMKDSKIPNYVCNLYRFAVNLNINWLFTGKSNINLERIYIDKIIT